VKKEHTEHFKLGFAHGMAKQERYKFQDPYLQELYEAGYESGERLRNIEQKFLGQTIPGFPGKVRIV
jgi:hypothetical protein